MYPTHFVMHHVVELEKECALWLQSEKSAVAVGAHKFTTWDTYLHHQRPLKYAGMPYCQKV
jgi:hypothetical protein